MIYFGVVIMDEFVVFPIGGVVIMNEVVALFVDDFVVDFVVPGVVAAAIIWPVLADF